MPETTTPEAAENALYSTEIGYELDGAPHFVAISSDIATTQEWLAKAFLERAGLYGTRFRLVAMHSYKATPPAEELH